jgi:hypothetical protein
MWGILPFGSSLLAIVVVFLPERKRSESWADQKAQQPIAADEDFVHGRLVS